MAQQPEERTISIDYVARVEGETALVLKIGHNQVRELKLKIFEPPRFFEGFLVGRKYDEAGDIVARICGICPISHMTTALQAVEAAMGITPSQQTRKLRRLMCEAQVVASHIIHLYMLALPDYFGYDGFLDMVPLFEKEKDNFLKMKEAMNKIGQVIGGRPLNPVSMVVNGFTKLPDQKNLLLLAEEIKKVLPIAAETVYLISKLPYPDLQVNTEFMALRTEDEYAFNEGHLISSKGLEIEIDDYPSLFIEHQEEYAMAKKCLINGQRPFMGGALGRINLKFDQLHEQTKRLADEIGFKPIDYNPFHNNLAQGLEIYNGMIDCLKILSELSIQPEKPGVKIRAGQGIAITEAPRGLLMHSYWINQRGIIEKANIVTPTSHNFANLERDLESLANRYAAEDDTDALRLKCEQLIRAYDPCFSCSVH